MPPYMDASFTEIAYKCGLYHQLGKAMLPQEYQIWSSDFTEEERKLYQSYPEEGRALVERLQGDGTDEEEIPVSSRMIREACAQHMERWDGKGFPEGRSQEEISLIAQLVGLARELDLLATELRSENPFEEAIDQLLNRKNEQFSANLISMLSDCRGELRAIYKKYIQYTKTLPRTIPLVDKRPERPMGLSYRPLIVSEEFTGIYEAVPWFKGAADRPDELQTMEEVEELLKRTGLLNDMLFYLFYEATDALVRMKNCGFASCRILMPVFCSFYEDENQWPKLEELFTEQAVDPARLMLGVPDELLRQADLSVVHQLTEYCESGLALVLDDYEPEHISEDLIREIGFSYLRPKTEESARRAAASLQEHGITVIGRSSANLLFTEDEMIRDLLMNETA